MLEELDGLRLDGVRVGKVLAQLLAHVVRLELAQRRLDCEIERRGEAFAHPLRLRDRLPIARTLGYADEELVCGQLEMLIRVRMRDELPRRVRLRAREEEEAAPPTFMSRSLSLFAPSPCASNRARIARSCPSVSVRWSRKMSARPESPDAFGAPFSCCS